MSGGVVAFSELRLVWLAERVGWLAGFYYGVVTFAGWAIFFL